MNRRLIIGLVIYLVWSGFWIVATIVPIGDGGVSAHLWLTVTGFPLAFLSWLLPHGSVEAVITAGILGAIQLLALIAFLMRRTRSTRQSIG
jgi:hypothetical protein